MPEVLSANVPKKTYQFLQQIMQQQSRYAMAAALRGIAVRKDTSYLLTKNNLPPILILTGDQDKVISFQQSERMHKLAKNSQLVIIKNSGHLSNLEQPEIWNKAVINFFNLK